MAAVNVDQQLAAAAGGGSGMVELSNGCICCTLRGDLFAELQRLARQPGIEHIVVESSGISEPRAIVDLYERQWPDDGAAAAPAGELVELVVETAFPTWPGQAPDQQRRRYQAPEPAQQPAPQPAQPAFFMDCLVTVVDAEKFLEHFASRMRVGQDEALRQHEGAVAADQRLLVELLIEQVECADVLLLNKADLVSAADLRQLQQLLRTMNALARIEVAVFGAVPLELVLGTGLYREHRAAQAQPRALPAGARVGNPDDSDNRQYASTFSGQSGIGNFTYRRPDAIMDPVKLHNLVAAWSSTRVLRSKGFAQV